VEATDGVVFVEEGRCRKAVLACLEWRITLAGDRRFLFVRVDAARSDHDIVASVGHELRHTIEVLENPGLRSGAEMMHLYLRKSVGGSRAAETEAALLAGDAVYREVRRSRGRSAR
jgi:hypothetical protein